MHPEMIMGILTSEKSDIGTRRRALKKIAGRKIYTKCGFSEAVFGITVTIDGIEFSTHDFDSSDMYYMIEYCKFAETCYVHFKCGRHIKTKQFNGTYKQCREWVEKTYQKQLIERREQIESFTKTANGLAVTLLHLVNKFVDLDCRHDRPTIVKIDDGEVHYVKYRSGIYFKGDKIFLPEHKARKYLIKFGIYYIRAFRYNAMYDYTDTYNLGFDLGIDVEKPIRLKGNYYNGRFSMDNLMFAKKHHETAKSVWVERCDVDGAKIEEYGEVSFKRR